MIAALVGRWRRYSWRDSGVAALCLLPSLVIFGVFFFWPLYKLFDLGTHSSNTFGTRTFYIGWGQFSDVLGGSDFQSGLIHSVLWAVYTVPVGIILGTLLAVAANRRLRGIRIFQTIFSSTIATSVAVASVIFYVLINPAAGFIHANLLNEPGWALLALSATSMWQNLGVSFVIVLAGLQAIPDELNEAATLDGYSSVRRFLRITLPLLTPVLMFLVVVLTVSAMQAYAQVDIITGGAPAGATETLVYKIYNHQQPAKAGVGAIMSIGLFGVTVIIAALQFLLLERRVQYGDE